MSRTMLAAIVASALTGPAQAQLVEKTALTLDGAKQIAAVAEAKAKAEGARVVIAVVDDGGAEIEFAQQMVSVTFDDGAAFKPGQERGGVFDTVQQALPHLIAVERFDQRVLQVVDLDEVFEIHGPMLASRPCNLNDSSRNTASVRARAAEG